jgi:hypothetical protein
MTQETENAASIYVPVPWPELFEQRFRAPMGVGFKRYPYLGPMDSYDRLLEAWLQEATLDNARRWSKAGHADAQVMLSLFTDDCPHRNPENDPKYDGVEFFQGRVTDAKWNYDPRFRRRPADPYTLAFMEAAAAAHPLVAEFEAAMSEWEDAHGGLVCELSPQGTICRTCAEAHDEWDEDGMEPSGCRLHDDVVEAYADFWFANGDRS